MGAYNGGLIEAPAGALPHEQAYLKTVHEMLSGYSKAGKSRLRRFYSLLGVALTAAAGVPVAVAAGAPAWAIASLGGMAAVAQGLEQLLQDQRLGVESHATAVQLSQELRKFHVESGAATQFRQRAVFQQFVDGVELILASQGLALIEALRQQQSIGAANGS
ncbi:MAG: SLATT domain-containing protein [Jatrophihabitantaceae bacterium]